MMPDERPLDSDDDELVLDPWGEAEDYSEEDD